ncbi:hypothetical protein CFP71_13380 [Amycolatopsis thailandensis]|uniref:HTH cro/C1-type domain-containing protein n=1 Tax=Amycolatopsis thailandensis TaxID=589330 RepID=A0A229SC49_9PSEU|nr:hypothetical protein CFP71_13380 [Amycolatopsis thailandensis]
MRGQASFDRVAMKSTRTAFPRPDRGRDGLSLDELADRVGTSRRQLVRYEMGEATPEPARIAALAAALECDVRELSGVAPDADTLRTLRRNAGLTLRVAATRVRPHLVRPRLRSSVWLLGEVEAGRLPAAWCSPQNHARVIAAMAAVYKQSASRVEAAMPACLPTNVVQQAPRAEVVPSCPLVTPAPDTWYARSPSCELVASPSSISHQVHADDSVDWSVPAVLGCSQCGTTHEVTPFDLLPHDSVITCPRSTCGKVTQVPAEAVEVVCVHCGLHPPGPAALLDPARSNVAKAVRYGHTLKCRRRSRRKRPGKPLSATLRRSCSIPETD